MRLRDSYIFVLLNCEQENLGEHIQRPQHRLANEVPLICESIGTDVNEVRRYVNSMHAIHILEQMTGIHSRRDEMSPEHLFKMIINLNP